MQVTSELIINDIYPASYTNADNKVINLFNLETFNSKFTSKYDRWQTYGIDKDCVDALQLDKSADKYKGKKCKVVFKINQYKTGSSLIVESITPMQ